MTGSFLTTLVALLQGHTNSMRQAGRYLVEYKAVRNSEPDFISFCSNSDKVNEVTQQPINKLILTLLSFSLIILLFHGLCTAVRFVPGTGPLMDPITAASDFHRTPWI